MEYRLLQVVHEAGLPVPEPLLLDVSGQTLSGPFLVTAFVEGATEVPAGMLDDCLEVMAATLIGIHRLPIDELPEMPARLDPLPELFDYLPESLEWRSLRDWLAGAGATDYRGPPSLLHGDFWPGNLLWKEGRLMAVLDWEDAALGDPVSDVAVTRLELLWRYGADAGDRFTRAYARERPVDARRLALWDVYVGSAAARFMSSWGLEPAHEARMRRLACEFVQAAGERLMSGNSSSLDTLSS